MNRQVLHRFTVEIEAASIDEAHAIATVLNDSLAKQRKRTKQRYERAKAKGGPHVA